MFIYIYIYIYMMKIPGLQYFVINSQHAFSPFELKTYLIRKHKASVCHFKRESMTKATTNIICSIE